MPDVRILIFLAVPVQGCSFKENSPPPTFPNVAIETPEQAQESYLQWSREQMSHAWLSTIPECPERLVPDADGEWVIENPQPGQAQCRCSSERAKDAVCWSDAHVPFGKRRYHPDVDMELRGRRCDSEAGQQCTYRIRGAVAVLVPADDPGSGSADRVNEDGEGSHLEMDVAPFQRSQRLDSNAGNACTHLYLLHRPPHSTTQPTPEELMAARSECERQRLPGLGLDPWSIDAGFHGFVSTVDAGGGVDAHMNIAVSHIWTGLFVAGAYGGTTEQWYGLAGPHVRWKRLGLDAGLAARSKDGFGVHVASYMTFGLASIELFRVQYFNGKPEFGRAFSLKFRHLFFF